VARSHLHPPPRSPPSPSTTLFRSLNLGIGANVLWRVARDDLAVDHDGHAIGQAEHHAHIVLDDHERLARTHGFDQFDRGITFARSEEHTLNSSHVKISYAVFCLKK